MSRKPKLVVHIGHGKTGSSSIQATLSDNRKALLEQGTSYLGIMLEHADVKPAFGWQFRGGSDEFFGMADHAEANRELFDALKAALTQVEKVGGLRAIWSNEWMFPRHRHVATALRRIADEGYDVELQCYLRRHDAWSRSAYIQWGLKHKTYPGQIRNFRQWTVGKDFRYASHTAAWHDTFGHRLRLFNYDTKKNVVEHFCVINGLRISDFKSDNVSPSVEELSVWAAYNGFFHDPMRPDIFEGILARAKDIPAERLNLVRLTELLPSRSDLVDLVEQSRDDIEAVNRLLAENDEPALDFSKEVEISSPPDPEKLIELLYRILFVLRSPVKDSKVL